MPIPDFTDDERFLINYVKSPLACASASSYMWGYIIGGALMAGFSAWYENAFLMLAAFVVVCGFRVYEERFRSQYVRLWRSIIEKYEVAAKG